MYGCVQCYAILWTSAGHVRLHTRLRCQSIRLWATGLLYGNRFSHCEVELWAVTDEASKVHKNTQVRILINGPRVGLSCTIQWKKCICTLLLPFFKLAKTKKKHMGGSSVLFFNWQVHWHDYSAATTPSHVHNLSLFSTAGEYQGSSLMLWNVLNANEVNDSVFDHFSTSAVFCVAANCGTNGISIYHCENKQVWLLKVNTLVFGSEKSSETFLILLFWPNIFILYYIWFVVSM